MASYDTQKNIIDAIKTIVSAEVTKTSTTSSKVGIVVEDPVGFSCNVDIGGQTFSCQLPEHLHSWIQANDIVIVQDLYGDGSKKIVTGKTGSINPTPSLVFFDEASQKNISGVDYVEDENGNKMDTYGTI